MWKKQLANDRNNPWYSLEDSVNARVEDAFQKAVTIQQIDGHSFLFAEMLNIEADGTEYKLIRSHSTSDVIRWGFEATHGAFCPCDEHMSALLTIARRERRP